MRRPAASYVLVLLVLLGLTAGVPGHARTAPAAADPPASASAGLSTVTLITGDRVRLQTLRGGQSTVEVDPARRPNGVVPQFQVSTRDDQLHVVPSDVRPLVPALLDPELFNVSSLVEQGFDDAASPVLPLVLVRSGAQPRGQRVPAAQQIRELPSVNAVAVETAKPEVTELFSAVRQLAAASARTGKRTGELGVAAAGPLAGVEKIWLDRRVEAQLDRSTGQISAPAAWEAGFDGAGVTLAVLDTGIDDRHPDLAGRVVVARDFTGEQDPRDHHGHGTHVASIAAGTGAASDGARRGVASGAGLVNGKVLGSDGTGLVSWIIAGMEWAVGVADADIVNLSLGASVGSDESTLMSQAVERLGTEHGTLFVVAAGNDGCEGCVLSPGDVPTALTVGAVDRADQLADFSSSGPVRGTFALKPDLTAPGVGIVAARATDAALGGEGDYLELSGTSMATPHVAGAAALLSQARPGLDAAGLKAALMSTAVPTAGLTGYQQGAGRVDVAKVLASPVLAGTGSVDFGYFAFPQAGRDPVRRPVSYHNTSDQPVTLQLAAELDGPVTVQPAQLAVPAGESATAEVVLDVAASDPGRFSGQVVAEMPGAPPLRTPIGFVVEPEHHELRITGVARDGRPSTPVVTAVVNAEDGTAITLGGCAGSGGPTDSCARVPEGTYSVLGFVSTRPGWQDDDDRGLAPPLHTALVGDPEVTVDRDTALVLDARDAVEVVVDTPAHKAAANPGGASQLTYTRTPELGRPFTDLLANPPGAQLEERLFVQPMAAVGTGRLATASRWRLEAPAITMKARGSGRLDLHPRYYQMDWFSDNSWQYPQLDGRVELPVADAGQGRPEDIAGAELDGALAMIRRTDGIPVAEQANRAAAAGAKMVAIYNDQPGLNSLPGALPGLALEVPTVWLSHEEGTALLDRDRSRPARVSAEGVLASPYVYNLVYAERDRVPDRLHYTAEPGALVRVDGDFHSQDSASMSYGEASFAIYPWEVFAMSYQHPLRGAPRSRTEYHVSDPDVRWAYTVAAPEPPYNGIWPQPPMAHLRMERPWTTYAPVERRRQSWLRQPLSAGLNPDFPVRRAGDWLVLSPGLGAPPGLQAVGVLDGDSAFTSVFTTPGGNGFETRFRLRQGDEVLADTPVAPGGAEGAIQLPTGDPQDYRMTFEVDNRAPWAALSTRIRTDWFFRSGRTAAPEPVPLMTVDYDLDLDLLNRLRVRGPHPVAVTIGHQGGGKSPVTDLTFAVSFDDGLTWRGLPARRVAEGRYQVYLRGDGSETSRFVSFRVGAKDATGHRVEQEIIRAAAVGPPGGR